MIDENDKVLPRVGLREDAFRRMEGYMAAACNGTVDVDITKHVPRMKPGSFITAFNEARKGYRDFGYCSNLIPHGYDVMRIKPQEMLSGRVRLTNTHQDQVNRLAAGAKVVPVTGHAISQVESNVAVAAQTEQVPMMFHWVHPIGKDTMDREAEIKRLLADPDRLRTHDIKFRCADSDQAQQAVVELASKGIEGYIGDKDPNVVIVLQVKI